MLYYHCALESMLHDRTASIKVTWKLKKTRWTPVPNGNEDCMHIKGGHGSGYR